MTGTGHGCGVYRRTLRGPQRNAARDGCAECFEARGKRGLAGNAGHLWSRRQESNLYLALRRRSFYPLNYGEGQDCQDGKPLAR
ncbi:protein of unknown function [Cupriavidus taiwanensis]|uniref:Uncharacterized protein n=1 Tax=Cupriavidus taiwanensis TaxID=164546 RepID=A0A375GXM5_9BURK|nr:hypothetical protein CBM2592_A170149 [Cupriavidus taiwanensis]SOY47219.1 hypothetical protein CBM2588_A130154 [Cupriavidus taiwanensis]SOY82690.1 hypothetical protein CBM2591_A210034 [Cupriavidus taiwanensis]SOZ22980.1 hypothetical protein CBM2608_A210004 [Cupriavidus taiwanensis]SOZ55246.1 hypothetical protein CBM2617_A190036 [Cupriavidus taiwanensis]